MVLDVSNSPDLQAKTGRAPHGRSLTAGTARPTPPPLVAAEGRVLERGGLPGKLLSRTAQLGSQ